MQFIFIDWGYLVNYYWIGLLLVLFCVQEEVFLFLGIISDMLYNFICQAYGNGYVYFYIILLVFVNYYLIEDYGVEYLCWVLMYFDVVGLVYWDCYSQVFEKFDGI